LPKPEEFPKIVDSKGLRDKKILNRFRPAVDECPNPGHGCPILEQQNMMLVKKQFI
jgi:hypothetical protein